MNYWLLKSEPSVYSIQDLARDRVTCWEGVRNYQARNFLRDAMKKGDLAFFYHSNAEPSGIAGIIEIIREGYPDAAAFEAKSRYHDPDSTRDKPVWYVVDVAFKKAFPRLIPLEELRGVEGLKKMPLLQRGQRLSVQPVGAREWALILKLAEDASPAAAASRKRR